MEGTYRDLWCWVALKALNITNSAAHLRRFCLSVRDSGECLREFPLHASFSVSSLGQPLPSLTLTAFYFLFCSSQTPHFLHFWKWVHFPISLLTFSMFFRVSDWASAVTPVRFFSPLHIHLSWTTRVLPLKRNASQEKLSLTTSSATPNLKWVFNTISSHLSLLV